MSPISEVEQLKLELTALDVCHLYIGDQLPYPEEKHPQIQQEREKLWLDVTVKAGPFENRVFWLHRELKTAYESIRPDEYDLLKDFTRSMFGFKCDRHLARFLIHLSIAYSSRTESHDYANSARKILKLIGYPEGLVDQSLKDLTFKELVKKILALETVWEEVPTNPVQ